MANRIKPSLTLNCVGFSRVPANDHTKYTDPDGIGKTKKRYYRYKKRIYLEDVESIEEYFYNEFKDFSKSPLCNIFTYGGDYFTAEISFKLMESILDRFDQNRTLIINN